MGRFDRKVDELVNLAWASTVALFVIMILLAMHMKGIHQDTSFIIDILEAYEEEVKGSNCNQ